MEHICFRWLGHVLRICADELCCLNQHMQISTYLGIIITLGAIWVIKWWPLSGNYLWMKLVHTKYGAHARQWRSVLKIGIRCRFQWKLLNYFIISPLYLRFLCFNLCDVFVLEKPRAPEPSASSSSKDKGPATVVSARLKSSGSGGFRGRFEGRRKPMESDPDVIFLKQQDQTPWRTVRYNRFIVSDVANLIDLVVAFRFLGS